MIKKVYIILITAFLIVVLFSCEEYPLNPYDSIDYGPPTDTSQIDPSSIAGLHMNIFKPTCANFGCHDGAHEPDFQTIESTYNTLVYHNILKNDSAGTYTYRVVPGNVALSLLYTRLTDSLKTISDTMMPLAIDPGSDWIEKRIQHLDNIRTWIENGAQDVLGNSPSFPNTEPYPLGVVAFDQGMTTTPFGKNSKGATIIPTGTTVFDLWFSVYDDATALIDLSEKKIKLSLARDEFGSATEFNLNYVGVQEFR
jgi:hypothetical protein